MASGRQVSFLFLPDGEDPDSVVRRNGAEALRSMIVAATPLPDYLFETLKTRTDLSRMDGKARLVELARPLLSRIPEGPLFDLMQQRLVELSGVTSPRTLPSADSSARPTRAGSTKAGKRLSPIATAISLLLQHPELARGLDLSSPLAQLETDSGIQLLAQLHHIVRETPKITTAGLIERFREDERRPALEKLATRDHLLGEDKVKTFFSETMATLEVQALAASIEELLSQSSEKDLTEADKTRLAELYRRREELRSGASNS